MAKILAPNKQYTGVSAGVAFVNGVGECPDPVLQEWFRDHGYEVEEAEEPVKTVKPFEEMTVPELKEYAAENSIDLGEASRKDDIIAAIKATQDGNGDGK